MGICSGSETAPHLKVMKCPSEEKNYHKLCLFDTNRKRVKRTAKEDSAHEVVGGVQEKARQDMMRGT